MRVQGATASPIPLETLLAWEEESLDVQHATWVADENFGLGGGSTKFPYNGLPTEIVLVIDTRDVLDTADTSTEATELLVKLVANDAFRCRKYKRGGPSNPLGSDGEPTNPHLVTSRVLNSDERQIPVVSRVVEYCTTRR